MAKVEMKCIDVEIVSFYVDVIAYTLEKAKQHNSEANQRGVYIELLNASVQLQSLREELDQLSGDEAEGRANT